MAHLHGWRRLTSSAAQSVDELAKLEQITELAERGCVVAILIPRGADIGCAPIGPCRWNERSAAVRQNDKNVQYAAPLDGVDHTQRVALKCMASANHSYFRRNILGMGSVSPLPSTA
jgi:hypothetical protein